MFKGELVHHHKSRYFPPGRRSTAMGGFWFREISVGHARHDLSDPLDIVGIIVVLVKASTANDKTSCVTRCTLHFTIPHRHISADAITGNGRSVVLGGFRDVHSGEKNKTIRTS